MLEANFLEIGILFSGGVFALIWGLGIALHREIQYENRILSVILFIQSIWLFTGVYFWSGYYLKNPTFYLLHLPFVYLSGPILYRYYQSILFEEKIPLSHFRWHYIFPMAVAIASTLSFT